jgi:hypothetical protein
MGPTRAANLMIVFCHGLFTNIQRSVERLNINSSGIPSLRSQSSTTCLTASQAGNSERVRLSNALSAVPRKAPAGLPLENPTELTPQIA